MPMPQFFLDDCRVGSKSGSTSKVEYIVDQAHTNPGQIGVGY